VSYSLHPAALTLCRQVWKYKINDAQGERNKWIGQPIWPCRSSPGSSALIFAATALHEHRFGWIRHSLVGLIAGGFSGYFLQTIVLTVVTGSGSLNELRAVDAAAVIIEALTGAVVGAIAMAAVGFVIKERSTKTP
jgi:hypothetical protein